MYNICFTYYNCIIEVSDIVKVYTIYYGDIFGEREEALTRTLDENLSNCILEELNKINNKCTQEKSQYRFRIGTSIIEDANIFMKSLKETYYYDVHEYMYDMDGTVHHDQSVKLLTPLQANTDYPIVKFHNCSGEIDFNMIDVIIAVPQKDIVYPPYVNEWMLSHDLDDPCKLSEFAHKLRDTLLLETFNIDLSNIN